MNTYTIHQFDPKRPSLYTGEAGTVQAGNIRSARTEAARKIRGKVAGPIVMDAYGMAYDVILDKKWA